MEGTNSYQTQPAQNSPKQLECTKLGKADLEVVWEAWLIRLLGYSGNFAISHKFHQLHL